MNSERNAYRPILKQEQHMTTTAHENKFGPEPESGTNSTIPPRPFMTGAMKSSFNQPKQWRGPEDGLPPVGTQVGVIDDGTLHYGADECGPVIAHVEDTAVVRMSYGLGCFKADYLLPIRADRERWIEEAGSIESRMPDSYQPRDLLEALYDAGLARLPEE